MAPVDPIKDETGNRRTENAGDRYPRHKKSNRVRLLTLREPIGQIQNNPREISSFGKPQKKTRRVQLKCRRYEAGYDSYYSPGTEDPGPPNARSDFVQKHSAGNLE